jgi:ribosomal protein S6--L-glutamate ligase
LSSLSDKDGNFVKETLPFRFPFVLKFDWGGEGETVHLIKTPSGLKKAFVKAGEFEDTGQKGFLLQEYIESGGRSLRVTVIGHRLISYWRVQKDPESFYSGVSHGAKVDYDSDKKLTGIAEERVRDFCIKTGINLAGFDLIFSRKKYGDEPLFLEINYFFGRKGLGGSEKFYKILNSEIKKWLKGHKISQKA